MNLGLPLVLATGNADKARELSELLSESLDSMLLPRVLPTTMKLDPR